MKIKEFAKGTLSRILRYTGILLVIYVSMVFYLALTERRNAFPRAITHNEAREAIADKAQSISCTLDDNTILEGFVIGNEHNNVLLYYPDADEDALTVTQWMSMLANNCLEVSFCTKKCVKQLSTRPY